MNSIAEDNLMHYGTPRHSGRYPWGSGDNPYQRSGDFLSRIEELKNQGLTETEIAKAMGMSTTQYRAQKSLAKDERRALDVARAKSLREDGLSLNEIAREMGFANDSSVRSLLNERSEARMNQAKKTAEFLKEQIAEKGMIDVGTGVERELGISKEKLKEALAILEAEGYPVYGGRIQQATNPGKHTTLQVVCPPGTEHNIGKTVSYETYQLDVERAEKAPAARNDILAKRFGLPMEGYTYYFTYEETLPHRKRSYWQMACSLGADLSQGDDFCAFTFLFPLSNGAFGIKTRNYITSSTLMKLPAAMRIKYDQFMQEGSLIVLEGTVLDMMQVYDDLDNYITDCGYDVRCFGYDPYNAREFVDRWASENGPFGIEKVIQGAKTESVPLGELKKLSEERMLLFDEDLMTFAMGNCITLEDTNGNRKLLKKRYEQKIDAVAAMMDAYIAYKANKDAFE